MSNKKSIFLSVGVAAAIMTGCGGATSGEATTGTGYYIDSAVSGVSYTCGTQSGVTGEDGSFTFDVGQSCTFKLGDIMLRSVNADNLQNQVKIVEDRVEVARMLQTLDKDGNPDNGITIEANVVAAMKSGGITALPDDDDKIAAVYEAIKSVEGYTGEVKTAQEAETHLAKAQSSQLRELLAGKTFYDAGYGGSCESVEGGQEECDEGDYLDKTVFNADATSITWTSVDGESIGESGTVTISIEGNRLITSDGDFHLFASQNSDYILINDFNEDGTSDGTTRLYFAQAKAQAYYESLKSGGGSATDNGGSAEVTKAVFSEAMLSGKTFYIEETEGQDVTYSKYYFNNGVMSGAKIRYQRNESGEITEVAGDKGGTYVIEDGMIKLLVDDQPFYMILLANESSYWAVRYQSLSDVNDGRDVHWNLSKPAHYPENL